MIIIILSFILKLLVSLPCPVTPVDLVFLLFTVALSVIDQLPTDQTAQLVLYVHFDCYHPVDICIKYIEYNKFINLPVLQLCSVVCPL